MRLKSGPSATCPGCLLRTDDSFPPRGKGSCRIWLERFAQALPGFTMAAPGRLPNPCLTFTDVKHRIGVKVKAGHAPFQSWRGSQPSPAGVTAPSNENLEPDPAMRIFLILLLLAASPLSWADVIECDNGDRYNGKVLSMDAKEVKLQNEIAGTLTIPRSRIVGIQLRPALAAPAAPAAAAQRPVANVQAPAVNATKLQFDPAAIERVQNEYLATATPEANQMFQEMLRGVQSGQKNMGDLRAQAASTLQELRAAQKEFGEDALGGILETYGEVLESFLRQTTPGTRAPALQSARPRPQAPLPK